MKKTFCVLIMLSLLLCLSACSLPSHGTDVPAVNVLKRPAVEMSYEDTDNGRLLTFSYVPRTADELSAIDLCDEYSAACAVLFALAEYEEDPEASIEMLSVVRGPEEVSTYDINFLKNQFDQYPYVIRSYFDGTSPSESYAVDKDSPVSILITENIYSRDEKGYVKLFFTSSGADSPRSVTLRLKESTGQWFLFSDSYMGLCSGIRSPEDDGWD